MNFVNLSIFMVLRAEKIKFTLFFMLVFGVVNFVIHIQGMYLAGSVLILLLYLKLQPYIKARLCLWKLASLQYNFAESKAFLKLSDIGISPIDYAEIEHKIKSEGEAVLAEIDQDGFFLLHYNIKFDLPLVNEDRFMHRDRHKIRLVALNSGIAIRKDFGKNYVLFSKEISALSKISSCCNVPRILRTDFKKHVLYVSYIPGTTIRQMLSDAGAKILDKDVLKQIGLKDIKDNRQWLDRIEEGKKYLKNIIEETTTQRIFQEVSTIHECGVCLYDIKYGNIIIEKQSHDPYLIDFENSLSFNSTSGWFFRKAREYDLYLLGLHFM